MWILTLRKVAIGHQLVVPSSSSDDDLPLVKHDARVNLNPGGVMIRYTQESALMSDSPSSSPSPYIMSGQRVGVGRGKVLIPNPECKGKGRTESASSNLTPRVQRCRPPPKIRGPPRTKEFTDDDMEEEKEELSDKLVTSLKHKMTALEEQVTESIGQLWCASQSHHEQVEVLHQGFRQPVTLQCSISIV
jgi:hypothetical protein